VTGRVKPGLWFRLKTGIPYILGLVTFPEPVDTGPAVLEAQRRASRIAGFRIAVYILQRHQDNALSPADCKAAAADLRSWCAGAKGYGDVLAFAASLENAADAWAVDEAGLH